MKTYENDASGNLFNYLRADKGVASDRALAIALNVKPPVVSKIRAGSLKVGATIILRAHETFGLPVAQIRTLLAEKA
jgi:hypothetical protein